MIKDEILDASVAFAPVRPDTGKFKTCICCLQKKMAIEFAKNRFATDGHANKCWQCMKSGSPEKSRRISDGYVRGILHASGIAYADITPEMIEERRDQIKIKRVVRRMMEKLT